LIRKGWGKKKPENAFFPDLPIEIGGIISKRRGKIGRTAESDVGEVCKTKIRGLGAGRREP